MVSFIKKFITKRTIFTAAVLLYSFLLIGFCIFRFCFSNLEVLIGIEGESPSLVTLVIDKGERLSYTRKYFFANFQEVITFYVNEINAPPEKRTINFERIRHYQEDTYPQDYSDIRDYTISRIVFMKNFRKQTIPGYRLSEFYTPHDMLILKTGEGKSVIQTTGVHPELRPIARNFDRLTAEFAWDDFRQFVLFVLTVSVAVVFLLYGLILYYGPLCNSIARLWSPVQRLYTRWPRISALAVLSGMVLVFVPGESERAFCELVPPEPADARDVFFLSRGSNFCGLEFKVPETAEKAFGSMTLELYEKGNPVPLRKTVLPEGEWKGKPSANWTFFPVFESRYKMFSLKLSLPSGQPLVLKAPPVASYLLIFSHAAIIGALSLIAALTWLLECLKKSREKKETSSPEPRHHPKRAFDYGMHYFRAFAIISIVFAHFYHTDLSFSIFNCSTIFFLFISGYLLIYLDRNDFQILTYYRKKFMTVLLPYIIIAALIYVYRIQNIDVSSIFWYYKNLPMEIILGYRICAQFWYIPFIAIVFLFTPLLMKMPRSWLRNITLVSLFVPLYAVRRDFLTGFLDSVEVMAFFVPIYLAGMCYALDKEKIDPVLRKYWIHLAVISVALTFFIYFRNTKLPVNTAALYVQKMCFTGLVVLALNRISHKKIRVLDLFAKYSFSIYFLHVFLGEPLITFFGSYIARLGVQQVNDFITFVAGICSLFTVLFICLLLKQITGRYSRNLFGG